MLFLAFFLFLEYNNFTMFLSGEFMKNIFLSGIKMFGKIFLSNILSIITVISISFIINIAFTNDIGYYAVGAVEGSSEPKLLYEHYYENGEDTKLTWYEEQGYVVEKRGIRSDVTATGDALFLIISALFTLSLAGTITYSYIWKEGNKDLNLIRFGRAPLDKYKGVKIGLVAVLPYLLVLISLAIGKNSFAKSIPVVLYKYLNCSVFSVIDVICGNTSTFGELSVLRMLLLFVAMLIVPVFFGLSYYIGYKDILISEKLIYKKQK